MPVFVLFVLIFPLIGGGILIFGFLKTQKVLKLFSYGVLTKGRLLDRIPTNTRINDQMVFKYVFEFEDRKGDCYKVIEKTHKGWLLEDDEEEPLLYLESNPDEAVLLDALPSSPQFDNRGNIIPASAFRAALALLPPLLVIVILGVVTA